MQANDYKEINQSQVASLIGLSRSRVSQIFEESGCPIVKSGKKGKAVSVNAPEFFKWYLGRHLSKELAKVSSDQEDIGSREEEEKRLVAARARKVELETQQLKGELVPITEIQVLLNEVAVIYGTGLESLSGRLANELAGIKKPAEIKERIHIETRRIRKATAGKLLGFRGGGNTGPEDGKDSGRTASKNGGSVGKRKKNNTSGRSRARAVPN